MIRTTIYIPLELHQKLKIKAAHEGSSVTQILQKLAISYLNEGDKSPKKKSGKITPLPKDFARYFWDTNLDSIDPDKNKKYVVERLMEYGDQQAINWLFKKYEQEDLKELLIQTPRLSKKSAHFWAVILHVPSKEVKCLSEEFQKTHRGLWKY